MIPGGRPGNPAGRFPVINPYGHLTNGSRSIPVVILLPLQAWFEAEGRPLPKEERYRMLRRWYARDRGVTVATEIVDLLSCAALPDPAGCDNPRPCAELQTA